MTRLISLLLALLLLSGAGGSAQAKPTELPADTVQVSVTTMTPLNPQPGKTLRLSGRLRNRSADDVSAIQVRLLLSGTPMAVRSEISSVAAGGTERDGPPTLAVSEPIGILMSDTSASWSLELPFDELPLTSPGVYVAGLEVIGTGTDGLTQRLGLTRTFLPWFPQDSVEPTRLAWLWPVTAVPDRALAGVQLSERTAAEMAPGGRLSRIVSGAGTARITWVLDPSLLQTAEDMADGYQIVTGPAGSQLSQGSGSTVASQWLSATRNAVSRQQVVATSYAMPDATALQRAGMKETVKAATEGAAADVEARSRAQVDQVLAWPTGAVTTPATARTFRDSGATQILLRDASLPPAPGLTYTPDGFATWEGLPVTLADSGITEALAMPQRTRGQALLARQRFLAEVAMTAGELPDTSRGVVAAPDPLWSPRASFLRQTLRALQQVPYARLTSLNSARRQATEVPRARVPYGPLEHDAELSEEYLTAIQLQQRRARRLEAILTQPAGFGYEQSVIRQAGGAWRVDREGGTALVRTISQQLRTQTSLVRVATTGTFTLPGDSGRIPVTVANDLDQNVRVGIQLETDEPARLQSAPIAPFEVPAGRKVSLEVEAKVVGSGTLPVRIQLTTPHGRRYGDLVEVQVRTTAYSRAAAYVVTGAFVILAFLLGMNFVRRARARSEHHEHR